MSGQLGPFSPWHRILPEAGLLSDTRPAGRPCPAGEIPLRSAGSLDTAWPPVGGVHRAGSVGFRDLRWLGCPPSPSQLLVALPTVLILSAGQRLREEVAFRAGPLGTLVEVLGRPRALLLIAA
jgi:hypothetical protein